MAFFLLFIGQRSAMKTDVLQNLADAETHGSPHFMAAPGKGKA